MRIGKKLLLELQKRLKIGNRRGVHLNAIPGKSNYKFDLNRLSHLDKKLPQQFVNALLSDLPLKFRISWKDSVTDLTELFEEEQLNLTKIAKSFENLINQTEAIEAEKGINTFGFGFPIVARRDKADNKLTVAPLLIWSLRIKRSKEFNTWEVLRNEDDPIYINEVLTNHIHNDCGIVLEPISNEMLDDGLISSEELIEICSSFIKSFNKTDESILQKDLERGLSNIVGVRTKDYYEKLNLSFDKPLLEFCGIFSIFEVQKQNIINDYAQLLEIDDLKLGDEDSDTSFQSFSSVETDPSQQSILHALETKRNILIQGPPGTGKSQTLTAILVNALESEKRVLVVCEKRTALEVLYNALSEKRNKNEKGLDEHCILIKDTIKDRSVVIDSFRNRVDGVDYRGYISRNNFRNSLEDLQSKAKALISEINRKHFKVGKQILGNKIWTDVVGQLLELSKNQEGKDKADFEKGLFTFSMNEYNALLALVSSGQDLYQEFCTINSESFIEPSKFKGDNPYEIEDKIHADFKTYKEKLSDTKKLHERAKSDYKKIRFEQLNAYVHEVTELRNRLIERQELNKTLAQELEDKYFQLRTSSVANTLKVKSKQIKEVETTLQKYANVPAFFDTSHHFTLGYKISSWFSRRKRDLLIESRKMEVHTIDFPYHFDLCFETIVLQFTGPRSKYLTDIPTIANTINAIESSLEIKVKEEYKSLEILNFLEGFDSSFMTKIETLLNGLGISTELKQLLTELKASVNKAKTDSDQIHLQIKNYVRERSDLFTKHIEGQNLQETIDAVEIYTKQAFSEFEALTDIEFEKLNLLKTDLHIFQMPFGETLRNAILQLSNLVLRDAWTSTIPAYNNVEEFIYAIENLIKRKENYFSEDGDNFLKEYKWQGFYLSLNKNEKIIVDQLREKADWKKSFLIAYLGQLLLKEADRDLPTNDNQHQKLTEASTDLEKEQLRYIKSLWKNRQYNEANRFERQNPGLAAGNLYLKKKGSKNIKLTLRQIIKKDIDLFSAFFPIILTSPDVASNLFGGCRDYFDIVLFDEASQLRLEDNLPAILKGKQVVIAGDEHQMPPSNYFSQVFDGAVDDEDDLDEEIDSIVPKHNKEDILLDCESLLDFGQEMTFHKKFLDFHYRSKHPFLIDFSNQAFYQGRLKPLPNSFEYVPIKYVQVGGTFSEHTNEAEAEMVLAIIEHNINKLPDGTYPSVGIATFNITQRNLIKSKIEDRKRFDKYKAFNEKIQELGLDDPASNKGFIKNLENIQGDERDIIILSTTYGISKDGSFSQRFGPINHKKGYKLLNVIITRAKYKVYCCTSIPESKFLSYKDYLATEGENNRYAVFYAYLAYCKSVSEGNWELRSSVLNALSENQTKNVTLEFGEGNELESPFEEEVYQRLVQEIDATKLIPQLQFAGFRIDIVYDPKVAGKPKIAIECDGAKYHSSREAYLYDRHRQKILEGHGFVFHRIWSTNWWRNPKVELRRLVEFIEKIENTASRKVPMHEDLANTFKDKLENLSELMEIKAVSNRKGTDELVVKSTEKKKGPSQSILFKEEVKSNSKVVLKYLNNNKSIKIQLVSKNKVYDDSKEEFKRIYQASPIAEAIIGHSTGDIVKIGGVDNFVEILQVLE